MSNIQVPGTPGQTTTPREAEVELGTTEVRFPEQTELESGLGNNQEMDEGFGLGSNVESDLGRDINSIDDREFDKMFQDKYGEGINNQEIVREQQKKKMEAVQRTTTEENLPLLEEMFSAMETKRQETGNWITKGGITFLQSGFEMLEDTYNTIIDVSNFSREFLGADPYLQNTDFVSRHTSKGDLNEAARTMIKFIGGFGAMTKAARAAGLGTTRKGKIAVAGAATALTEFTFNDVDEKLMLQDAVTKLPISSEIIDFIDSTPGDPVMEKRTKQAVFGVAEGALATGFFKALKGVRNLRFLRRAKEAEIRSPELPTSQAVEDIPTTLSRADQPPPIPQEALIRHTDAGASGTDAARFAEVQTTERGARNKLLMTDADGNRVYFNVMRNNTTDDVRRSLTNMIENNPERFANERITFDDIKDAADFFNLTPEQLTRWSQEEGLQLGQIYAARELSVQYAEGLSQAARMYKQGDITLDQFTIAYRNSEAITRQLKDMQTLSSAIFRESAVPVDLVSREAKDAARVFSSSREMVDLYGEKALDQLATSMAQSDGRSVSRALGLGLKKGGELLTQIRYGSLLSNPATHARNMGITATVTASRPAETLLAATMTAMRRDSNHREMGVQFGEAGAEFMGMFEGFWEAMAITARKAASNFAVQPHDRAFQRAFTNVDGGSFLGTRANRSKIPDEVLDGDGSKGAFSFLGNVFVKASGSALRFEDDFMKHINARMTLNREAFRRARSEVGSQGDPTEFANTIRRIKEEIPEEVRAKMYKDAEYFTFTNKVDGPIAKSLADLTDPKKGNVNKFMSIIAPFARTNLNAMNYRLERVPGLNLLTERGRREWNHVDPAIRDQARAKAMFLSTLSAGIAFYLKQNDAITGSRPLGQGRFQMYEAAGYQPESIKVRDKWIQYRAESPLGGLLKTWSTIFEIQDIIDGDDDTLVNDVATALNTAIMSLYRPEYLADSTSQLLEALANEDVDGAQSILELGGNIASQHLPYTGLIRQLNRTLTDEGAFKRDMRPGRTGLAGVAEAVKNEVLSIYRPNALAIKRNMLGDPIMHAEGFGPNIISPLGVVRENPSPVIREMARLSGADQLIIGKERVGTFDGADSLGPTHQQFDMPSRMFQPTSVRGPRGTQVPPVRLNAEQYEKLVKFSAGIHPDIPKELRLEQTLKRTMNSRFYKESSDPIKAMIFKEIISNYQRIGRDIYEGKEVGVEEVQSFNREVESYMREKFDL